MQLADDMCNLQIGVQANACSMEPFHTPQKTVQAVTELALKSIPICIQLHDCDANYFMQRLNNSIRGANLLEDFILTQPVKKLYDFKEP
jgi:hypothetical protein